MSKPCPLDPESKPDNLADNVLRLQKLNDLIDQEQVNTSWMKIREVLLSKHPVLLKCLQIYRLFLPDQLTQARCFEDKLFDLP